MDMARKRAATWMAEADGGGPWRLRPAAPAAEAWNPMNISLAQIFIRRDA
jgi:hypothetical protein